MLELNKIYNMDCLEGMKLMPDKSVDLIVTDPPYEFISKDPHGGGFMKQNKKHLKELNDSFGMTFDPNIYLQEFQRILKKFNLYVFTNKNLIADYLNFAIENKYSYDILLWLKPNPTPCFNGKYMGDKEYCIFMREKGVLFNSKLGYSNYFTYYSYPIGNSNTAHPTEKPLPFIIRNIEISSNKNDIICDPFMGSGTTAVAAINTNRQFIGFELSEEYCNIANKRIHNARQQITIDFGE